MITLIIILTIILIILILLANSKKPPKPLRKKVKYSDHAKKPVKVFFSEKYQLTGKPDYILKTKDGLIPLEIKSSLKPSKPYYSHVMQLISYCLLMEEEGNKPEYGLLQYKNGNFFVSYNEKRKEELLNILKNMREVKECPAKVKSSRCGKCKWGCF